MYPSSNLVAEKKEDGRWKNLKALDLDAGEAQAGRKSLSLLKNGGAVGRYFAYIETRLDRPKSIYFVDLQHGRRHRLAAERGLDEEAVGEVVEEKFIDGQTLTSTFLFSRRTLGADSPLIVWFSDTPNFDLHNVLLTELLKRDFVVLLVKAKRPREMDLKLLADEFHGLSLKVAINNFSKLPILLSEGPRAGFAALNSHLENLGVYRAAVFLDPITDLLDLHAKHALVDFGFGPGLPATQDVDTYSPYHCDFLHNLKNTLFMSSSHEDGFDAFKLYSLAKHRLSPSSQVYWTKTQGNKGADTTIILTFIWKMVKQIEAKAREKSGNAEKSKSPSSSAFDAQEERKFE